MRILYKIFKYLIYFIIALFVLVLAIFKIPAIRHEVLDYALESVNAGLQGKIHAEDIDLVNLSGIKLTHASLIAGCDTVAYVPELYLKLNAIPMINNKISVQSIELNYPVIKIIRSKDSTLNLDHIAYPSQDTTTSGNTDLQILVDRIRIKQGRFELIDSLRLTDNREQINYSDMIFEDVEMDLEASADLLHNTFKASVDKFVGKERNCGLNLSDFSGDLKLSPEGVFAENTTIRIGEQIVNATVAMKEYNVFGVADLEKAVFEIDVKSENLEPKMSNKFVDMPLDFIGVQDIDMIARGTLNDFEIEHLNYYFGSEQIALSGLLKNLLKPEDFEFDIEVENSSLNYSSISKKIIGIPWENIPDLGTTQIQYLRSSGNLDTISAEVSMKSQAGDISGEMGVNLKTELGYSADIDFKNLNLAKFLHSKEFRSDFTGKCNVRGRGVMPEDMLIDIDLLAENGHFSDVKFEEVNINLHSANRGWFEIDTLSVVFPNDSLSLDFLPNEKSAVEIGGYLAFLGADSTEYDLNLELVKLNLAKILDNKIMPSVLSCDVRLDGENFEINKIKAKIDAEINELLLSDKYLMPFGISLENSFDENHRFLKVNSDFLDLNIDGQFNYTDLIDALSDQSSYLSNFIQNKINTILPDSAMSYSLHDTTMYEKKAEFLKQDITLKAKVKNTSIIRSVLEDIDLDMVANIDFTYKASGGVSNFILNKCEIPYLRFSKEDQYVKTNSLMLAGELAIALKDSLPEFSTISFMMENDNSIFVNDLQVDSLYTSWDFNGQKFDYELRSIVNDDIRADLKGGIQLKDPGLDLTLYKLYLSYLNTYTWQNRGNIDVNFTGKGLEVNNFELQREQFEKLVISGKIDSKNVDDLNITLFGLDLHHLVPLVPEDSREYVEELYGGLDSLEVNIFGETLNPQAEINFNMRDIVLNKYQVGQYYGKLKFKDNDLTGYTRLESEVNGKILKSLYADIFSFPINISQDTTLHKSAVRVMARAERFPLVIADPFVPNVSDIRGEADAYLDIAGNDMDHISWKGYVDLLKSQLRLDATNILYNASGKVLINKDTINIAKLNLSNVKEEKYKGSAIVTGYVTLADFLPDKLDITVKANQFQVLNNSTVRSMPDLYGDFVISTDSRPIRFWGTLLKPNLEGDINVVYASLKMPDMNTGKLQYSKLRYNINNDETLTVIIDNPKMEMPPQINSGFKTSEDIADLINYDLKIKILDKLSVQMDLGLMGQLSADVTIKDKNLPLIYKKNRDQLDAQLIGSLQVLESSVLNIAKIFKTYGEITFPTGELQNPTLNLTAEYTGVMYDRTIQKNYTVKIFVTGTKDMPKLEFSYLINGEEATGDKNKIQQDAMMLLAVGRLGGTESTNGSNSDVDKFKALVSGQASKYLTDILTNTGLVNNVDIEVNSDEFSESKMKFSGELWGLNYQVGSTVGNMGDNQIILNIPFFKLFDSSILPNISGQVSISQTSGERNQLQERKKFEFKLRFGGSK